MVGSLFLFVDMFVFIVSLCVYRRKLIEEERRKMLQEHAEHLLGYLPKGVLRADDLEYLGGTFKEQFLGKK